jgi:hypothetical protein
LELELARQAHELEALVDLDEASGPTQGLDLAPGLFRERAVGLERCHPGARLA